MKVDDHLEPPTLILRKISTFFLFVRAKMLDFYSLRHRQYKRVAVTAANGSKCTYLMRELQGKLYRVPQKVRVRVSRKHHRDKRPVYLMGTDLALSEESLPVVGDSPVG